MYEHPPVLHPGKRPLVICICGSTRFLKEMHQCMHNLTLEGKIVIPVGTYDKSDDELGITPKQKLWLEALHRHKIDLADEILVVNVGGYIGDSTRREIVYANMCSKTVRYLESVDHIID